MLKKFKASNLCIGKESRRASWVHVVGSDDPEKKHCKHCWKSVGVHTWRSPGTYGLIS